MTLGEITKEACSLNEKDRATLATALLGTLDPPDYDVSDEEVEKRR